MNQKFRLLQTNFENFCKKQKKKSFFIVGNGFLQLWLFSSLIVTLASNPNMSFYLLSVLKFLSCCRTETDPLKEACVSQWTHFSHSGINNHFLVIYSGEQSQICPETTTIA